MSSDISFFNQANVLLIRLYGSGQNGLDLTNCFVNLHISENIFSPCLFANLTISDTDNLATSFPIKGGETVEITFSDSVANGITVDNTVKLYFMVKSVMPDQKTTNYESQNQKITVLNLISPYGIMSKLHRISHRFKDKASVIINLLMQEFGGLSTNNIEIYDDFEADYVSNFWDMNENIDYLKYLNVDGMHFETLKKRVFAKLSTLTKLQVKEIWDMNRQTMEYVLSTTSVRNFRIISRFDILESLKKYSFGNVVYNPNLYGYPFKAEFVNLENVYKEAFKLMGSESVYYAFLTGTDCYNTVVSYVLNSNVAKYRNMVLNQLSDYNVVCRLNGSVKRGVGDLIQFDMPSVIYDNRNNSVNLKGLWLITKIEHEIDSNMKYWQDITIFKNAFKKAGA